LKEVAGKDALARVEQILSRSRRERLFTLFRVGQATWKKGGPAADITVAAC
jgi:hypothetical protein